MYHFIHLDTTEGIILCPAEPKTTSQTYEAILNNFRQCCQKIHALFQSTLRFKVNYFNIAQNSVFQPCLSYGPVEFKKKFCQPTKTKLWILVDPKIMALTKKISHKSLLLLFFD